MESTILILVAACLIGLVGTTSVPHRNVSCTARFAELRECKYNRTRYHKKYRQARLDHLNKRLDACFVKHGCTPPARSPPKNASAEVQECRKAFRKAKRERVIACVRLGYPKYLLIPPKHPDHHAVDQHHIPHKFPEGNLNCANASGVQTCWTAAVRKYHRKRFQRKCGLRAFCKSVLGARCRDKLKVIKKLKCECRKKVSEKADGIRKSIKACEAVPKKDKKKSISCPKPKYCKLGFEDYLRDRYPSLLLTASNLIANAGAISGVIIEQGRGGGKWKPRHPAGPGPKAGPLPRLGLGRKLGRGPGAGRGPPPAPGSQPGAGPPPPAPGSQPGAGPPPPAPGSQPGAGPPPPAPGSQPGAGPPPGPQSGPGLQASPGPPPPPQPQLG